jgi:hypothetical protein
MSSNRRHFLNQTAFLALTLPLAMAVGPAWAALPVVEIIAFAHPPVISALKPLREWLTTQSSKLKVIEVDMESPEGERRLKALGITGHVPVVVLVDGKYKHTRKDGSAVEFVSFPSGPGTPAGVKGGWSAEDVKTVIQQYKP